MKAGKIILQTESESSLQFYFNDGKNMALKEENSNIAQWVFPFCLI